MDLIKLCANQFHRALEGAGLDSGTSFDVKRVAFNVATASLIASVAFGILGVISLRATIVLGGLSLLGRVVVGESFKSDLLSRGSNLFAETIKFANHVLFYV